METTDRVGAEESQYCIITADGQSNDGELCERVDSNSCAPQMLVERVVRRPKREQWCRRVLDALPAAIYTTDAAGRVTYYNQAAADLAGRRPELGKGEWCVTWRLLAGRDADAARPVPDGGSTEGEPAHSRC